MYVHCNTANKAKDKVLAEIHPKAYLLNIYLSYLN